MIHIIKGLKKIQSENYIVRIRILDPEFRNFEKIQLQCDFFFFFEKPIKNCWLKMNGQQKIYCYVVKKMIIHIHSSNKNYKSLIFAR